MEPPMATVTCSDGSEWTKWHPPDTLDSVTHSSCLIMISLWLTSATQSNVITITETMIQDQPPQQTKTGSLLWGPRRLRGAQLTKQASLLSSSREPRADGQWPHVSPWTHVTQCDFWAGQSSSYLVEFTFSCETRMECSVSVSQGINRRSSAESRLSSRDLLPKIRA